ncbi:hypothetical protein HUO09_17890 [Vibrio sp. Y2-5]|uniref:hypothetical protein n=1 Tax=Vibrio sp. Y2-5 TaxID=2743977 RepID=UPI0016606F7C|nr:hypothetical protein [Vibrio sp. Y2-5]MBD0788231.1 hypothetical protein [Vibrio sp. Y2-5]
MLPHTSKRSILKVMLLLNIFALTNANAQEDTKDSKGELTGVSVTAYTKIDSGVNAISISATSTAATLNANKAKLNTIKSNADTNTTDITSLEHKVAALQ